MEILEKSLKRHGKRLRILVILSQHYFFKFENVKAKIFYEKQVRLVDLFFYLG